MAEFETFNAGGQAIHIRKDLRIPMRDGIELAADAYEGVDGKPRPALVALSPYGKELQALALTTPPQRRPSPMWGRLHRSRRHRAHRQRGLRSRHR